MNRSLRASVAALLGRAMGIVAFLVAPSFAIGAPPTPSSSATTATSASKTTTVASSPPSLQPSANALPPGHPSLEGPAMPAGPLPDGVDTLPEGHPNVGAPPGAQPQVPEPPSIPQDDARPDAETASGAITARILDESGHPVVGVPVTLGIIHNTVAQGESRQHLELSTNGDGDVTFHDLHSGSGWAYRVSVENRSPDGGRAKFGAPPFSLPLDRGYRVVLHRFPVSSSIDSLMVAVGGVDTIVEVRDDVVEVQQMYEVINAGLVAWSLGDGLLLTLPKGAKGVRAQDVMQDVRVAAVEGTGVRWEGSFAPGDTQITYDFKVPYEGSGNVDLDVEMPPRVLAARVRLAARRDMSLSVDDFPAATSAVAESGVHVLETTKRGSPQDQIKTLHVHIGGLPTHGAEHWIATAIAFVIVFAGLAFTLRGDATVDPKLAAEARARRRATIVDDLVALERARRAEEIGPKAYARERAKLVDALADALDPPEPPVEKKSKKTAKKTADRESPRRRAS